MEMPQGMVWTPRSHGSVRLVGVGCQNNPRQSARAEVLAGAATLLLPRRTCTEAESRAEASYQRRLESRLVCQTQFAG